MKEINDIILKPTLRCKHICNSHKPTRKPKIAKELPPFTTKEKLFLKIPSLQNIFKTQPHNPRQTALQLDTKDRTAGRNSTLPKVAVSCFVGQVCRYINFSASYES